MPDTASLPIAADLPLAPSRARCRIAVVWIDWYAYHVARFRGIRSAIGLAEEVCGIELVGGIGVHAGLQFREDIPPELPVETLMPDSGWCDAGQLRLARKLWHCLSRLQPEIVLVPGYYTLPGIAAALWARLHRRASVLMTESTAADHARSWWKERVKSLLLRALFDWAVTGGKAHVRYLRQLGFPPNRIAGFYDVVDNDFFQRRSQELRDTSRGSFHLPGNYFLYIGRLAAEKNVEGLLSSWISYRESGGTWSLVLVGDGPCAEALRHAANASPFAADVHFAGHRGSSELPVYYAFAGCFVLPSTREPWGLVVNEAMASGLPVLVSNRCGCAEDLVKPHRNGFVFDPANRAELTFLLQEIEFMGDRQRRAMSLASMATVNQYSPRALGREIERICSSRTSSPRER